MLHIYSDGMVDEVVTHNCTDRLFDMDGKGEIAKSLAESHSASPDGLEHRFRIRAGRHFHDGVPVTADICAGALRKLEAFQDATIFADSFVDLRIVLKRQNPTLLNLLATCPIVNEAGAGSGPYRIVEDSGDYLILELHRDHPHIVASSFETIRLERLPAHLGNYTNLLEAGHCVLLGSGALSWASRNRARGKWAAHVFATGSTHLLTLKYTYEHADFAKSVLHHVFMTSGALAGEAHLREAISFYPKGSALYEPIRVKRVTHRSASLRLAVTRGLLYPGLMRRISDLAAEEGLNLHWAEVDASELMSYQQCDGRIVACAIDARDPLQSALSWFGGELGVIERLPLELKRLLSRVESVVRPSDRSAFLRQFYFNLFAHGPALPLFFSPNALVYSLDVDTADLDFYAGNFDFVKLTRATLSQASCDDPSIDFKMLAHDLRKPFTLIKAIISVLKATDDPVRVQGLLQSFVPEIERVTGSVEGMLRDLMQREGPTTPRLSLQSIRKIAEESVRVSVPPDSAIEVKFDLRHDHLVEVDRDKIDRVMNNLVTNAAQAMAGLGRIWIETAEIATSAGTFVEVKVGNTNSYIAPEDLKHLFQPWFTKGKEGGTGLGLAIAQRFVQSHGGTITVRSSKDAGTEFAFTLPASSVRDRLHKPPTRAQDLVRSIKVAVVEDNVFLLELWREQLGDEVCVFESPEEFFLAANTPNFLDGLDAVITDYYFDEKSSATGADVARFLQQRDFSAKVFLASDSIGLEAELTLFHARRSKEPPTRDDLLEWIGY